MEKTTQYTSIQNSYSFQTMNINNNANIFKTSMRSGGKIKSKSFSKGYKKNYKHLLSDLEKTYDINIDIIKNFYRTTTTVNTLLNKDNDIITHINTLNKIYHKKKELVNKVKEKKSKLLIELQIFAEKKRKNEEAKECYDEKIMENMDNIDSKEELIKKVQKRLKEVEIYVHKQGINLQDKNREKYYQNFYISDFLDVNNEFSRKKFLLTKSIEKIGNQIANVTEENKTYKSREKVASPRQSKLDLEEENFKKKEEKKINKYIVQYEAKIQLMNSKINILKSAYEKITEISFGKKNMNLSKKNVRVRNINYKKLNPGKLLDKRDKNEVKIDNDGSAIFNIKNNDDINNRMSSFFNLSTLNNKNEDGKINDTSKEGGDFNVLTKSNIWDISAINAKDISYIDKK